MYEFWYDYVKLKYDGKTTLCFMDTDSSTVYITRIIFTKILQKMLKQDLTLQIMNQKNHCLKGKIKKQLD